MRIDKWSPIFFSVLVVIGLLGQIAPVRGASDYQPEAINMAMSPIAWQSFEVSTRSEISAMAVDEAGGIWLGFQNGKLSYYDTYRWTHFSPEEVELGHIRALHVGRGGEVFIGGKLGMRFFKNGWKSDVLHTPVGARVHHIEELENGNLVVVIEGQTFELVLGDNGDWTSGSFSERTFTEIKVASETQSIETHRKGNWRGAWDEDALYFSIRVFDDALFKASVNVWEQDGVELFIDGNNEKGEVHDENDLQLILNHDTTEHLNTQPETPVEFQGTLTYTGYTIEITVPWATIGVSPKVGHVMGLDFYINDDLDGTGAKRLNRTTWHTSYDMCHISPFLMGEVTLESETGQRFPYRSKAGEQAEKPRWSDEHWIERKMSASNLFSSQYFKTNAIKAGAGDGFYSISKGNRLFEFTKRPFEVVDHTPAGVSEIRFINHMDWVAVAHSQATDQLLYFDGRAWHVHPADVSGISVKFQDFYLVDTETALVFFGGLAYLCSKGERRTISNFPIDRCIVEEGKSGALWFATDTGLLYRFDYQGTRWKGWDGLTFFGDAADGTRWFLNANRQAVSLKEDSWSVYGVEDGLMDVPWGVLASSTHSQVIAYGSHEGSLVFAQLKDGRWRRVPLALPENSHFKPNAIKMLDDGRLLSLVFPHPQLLVVDFNSSPPSVEKIENEFLASVRGNFAVEDNRYIWFTNNRNLIRMPLLDEGANDKVVQFPGSDLNSTFDMVFYGEDMLWLSFGKYGQVARFNTRDKVWDEAMSELLFPKIAYTYFSKHKGSLWLSSSNGILQYNENEIIDHGIPDAFFRDKMKFHVRHDANSDRWINVYLETGHPFSPSFEFYRSIGECYRQSSDRFPPKTIELQQVPRQSGEEEGTVRIAWKGVDKWEETASDALSYSYRINGKAWTPFSAKSDVLLANLEEGAHTFEVRARDSFLNIESEPAMLRFEATVPIRLPDWFWYLMGVVLVGAAALIGKHLYVRRMLQKTTTELKESHMRASEISARLDKMEAERLHKIAKLRLDFYANISHEFRTPLTMILTPLEKMIKTGIGNPKQFVLMKRNAEKLLQMVNQLLDLNKWEGGKQETVCTNGDVAEFVQNAVFAHLSIAQDNGIFLNFNISPHSYLCRFDKIKLETIIRNLLSNALKYAGTEAVKGTVNVLATISADSVLTVKVEDNGKGIPAEEHERIFQRFYQAGKETDEDSDGFGIGLSFSRELAQSMEGDITVESPILENPQGGAGTRFIFQMKLQAQTTDESTETETWEPYSVNEASSELVEVTDGKPILLVVEDSSDIRSLIHSEFSEQYQIVEAVDGVFGVEKASELIPDIIVSDVMMPRLDGIGLCKTLKNDPKTCHIPIVLLTARKTEEYEIQSLDVGADAYIIKPFSLDVLQARISNLLSNRNQLRLAFQGAGVAVLAGSQEEEVVSTLSPLDQEIIEKAQRLVADHLSDTDFGPHEFAKAMGMSPSTLYRKFKAITDETPGAFVQGIRLQKAAEMLKTKQYNVSEVAFEVGFSDSTYFGKCFKKKFGVSPSAY